MYKTAQNLQAAEFAKCEELLTWASRYNLFVQWSPDKQHPWDVLADSADGIAATLEIGKEAGGKQVGSPETCLVEMTRL